MEYYLTPTFYLDFDHPEVLRFALENTDETRSARENAVSLFYAVRDGFKYDPYRLDLRPSGLKASSLLKKETGYCVEKAVLLAASARAVGIASRLSFYIVANHIATEKFEQILGTNELVFHGAAEMFLDGKWLKTTPAFNEKLCRRLRVTPLEFDGTEDAIFQQFDDQGNVFMEYLHDYGNFADMPYELAVSELKKHYPHIFQSRVYMTEDLVYNLAQKV
ncbi:MAG: transglutaminase family protein [Pyrinomonadaceae bacterium]